VKKECNLCGNTEFDKLFSMSSDKFYNSKQKLKNLYTIMKCKSCGLVFVDESPNMTELKDIYSKGYYFGRDECGYKDYAKDSRPFKPSFYSRIVSLIKKPNRLKRIYNNIVKYFKPKEIKSRDMKLINKYFSRPGRLLDVGCAMGYFLDTARNDGWDVTGVEISDYASSYARDELKLNVFNGELERLIQDEKIGIHTFDVVTLWDTLEHVCDPKSLLRAAYSVLKEDGMLFLSTLNIDSLTARQQRNQWHYFRPPKHLFYFSEKTLKRYLAEAGFEVVLDDDFSKDTVVVGVRKKTE
jgi:2-polyprenyl-3-methyl-5-hydroxy-6-metoxy-1,4-benzoquinol methylase